MSLDDPSRAEFDAALNSLNPVEREEMSENEKYDLTDSQYEFGLTDRIDRVRAAYANRSDFKPNTEQIERGLTDSSVSVRLAFACNSKVLATLSIPQIKRGKNDRSETISDVFRAYDFSINYARRKVKIDDYLRLRESRKLNSQFGIAMPRNNKISGVISL
jgi:hypothetical protein